MPNALHTTRVGTSRYEGEAWMRPLCQARLCPPYFELAPLIARHSRSGVAGISTWRMPRCESASTSALATAGMAPTHPASPAPFTPSGLVLVGTGLLLTSTALRSVARGIA